MNIYIFDLCDLYNIYIRSMRSMKYSAMLGYAPYI